jgi:alcohol dehydrogenase (cytochrome c)
MRNRILLALVFFVSSSLFAQVTYQRILHANQEPQNWLTYSGGYAGHRYSTLTQINRDNVKNLQMQWVYRPAETGRKEGKMENTPLVVDGVLYAGSAQEVVALDAVTGRQYWKYSRPLDPNAYYNAYVDNRGLAIDGDNVFWATDDCHLIALDAKNGQVMWDVTMADWKQGYQFNVAPLIVRNMIILGPATNEAGSNCWVAAYDVKTGKEIWRHYTAPMSAGDPGAKSWVGDSWKHAGDPIWGTGSYDPETNLVFWGTGNPNPGWSGSVRAPGDNLYSDSVLALDADTGEMKWYFQFTPGDEYDWDATQVPVLVDLNWHGAPRKVMLWANRNGFFYVLDRTTGKFLLGKPFIKVNWATGLDKDGRPIKAPGFWPKPDGGVEVMPGSQGGTNWYPPSYDPQTGLFYLSVWDNYLAFSGKGDPGPWAPGQRYVGNGRPVPCVENGHVVPGSCGVANPVPAGGTRPGGMRIMANFKTPAEGYGAIRAIDPETGEKRWDFKMVNNTECGVLSTAGGLVFGGGMDGDFVALDAKTGQPLWHVYLGGPNASGPISYAVNGKQYIIGTGDGAMYSFALPD